MIVLPFHCYLKYWAIIVAVIVIFVALIHLGPKPKPHQNNFDHIYKKHGHTNSHDVKATKHNRKKIKQKKNIFVAAKLS